jgi:2-polyprenyl-3-methyl-5-hydroxy-6-metoxy-1,4-benzoquinol methylase
MNKVSSGSDYIHGESVPANTLLLYSPIRKILQEIQGRKILDIGCGNGSLLYMLKQNNTWEYGKTELIGVDTSESGIENAKIILPDAKFYRIGVYDDPERIEQRDIDVVLSTEVIEHLFYPRELLRFAGAKLKIGGYILISTPYHGYLKNLSLSVLNKWDHHHTVFWDGGHIKFWSRKTLSSLLEEEGFEVKGFVGCGRVPYLWKSMILIGQLKRR